MKVQILTEQENKIGLCFDSGALLAAYPPELAIEIGKELQRLGEEAKKKTKPKHNLRHFLVWVKETFVGFGMDEKTISFDRLYKEILEAYDNEPKDLQDIAAMEHLRKLAKTPCGGIRIASELGWVIEELRPHHIQIGEEILTEKRRSFMGDLADAILSIPIEEK